MKNKLLHFDVYNISPHYAVLPRVEGENAREILLLRTHTDNPAVPAFLERVLQAAQIRLAKDTLHVAVAQEKAPAFALLQRKLPFRTLLCFGFSPADLGLQIAPTLYKPIAFMHKTLLFSDSLDVLLEERSQGGSTRSGQLWKALKQLFLSS